MIIFKLCIAAFLLMTPAAAEKKIELQDIEEDNLRSENEKTTDTAQPRGQGASGPAKDILPLEFLKNGILRYFENPQVPHQRYVQQYDVTEPPEKPPTAKPQYDAPTAQANRAMVGYIPNIPMQVYFVPQYFQPAEQAAQSGIQYSQVNTAPYQTGPDSVQSQNNYIEVPAYLTPSGKAYIPQLPQFAYVYSPQPTTPPTNPHVAAVVTNQPPLLAAPQASPSPYTYHVPVIQFQQPANPSQKYYSQYIHYADTHPVNEVSNEIESPRYSTQTEAPFTKGAASEFPRYYNSRAPLREDQRHSGVPELPHPSPLLLRPQPPHLVGIPKVLPMYRPFTKPMYSHLSSNIVQGSGGISQRPSDVNSIIPFKKRPTSLLDSYIPSSLQLEYLKRGITKDPISTYELLSSGRYNHYPQIHPRQLERGFLPNQVFHTAAGGVTYGHYKRTPKSDKITNK